MGKTTRNRKTELAEVQRRGFEAGRPFHYGEFWQACGKAGPENQYTGVYARREKGKRWGEIVVQWDGQETRIGTFERVKGKDGEPVWMGRLELTGEWSRLPRSARIDEAHIHDENEDLVRDYLVNKAVEYFVSCGRPETEYTTTGEVHSNGVLGVAPLVQDSGGGYDTRFVTDLSDIDGFNPHVNTLPILEPGSELSRSAVGSHVVVGEMSTVECSTLGKGCVVNGNVHDSYLGNHVWVENNAKLSHAFIGGNVRIGRSTYITGSNEEKAEINAPEVHIPAGAEISSNEDGVNYLVLGPIGGSSLTAVENVDGSCTIKYGPQQFSLKVLIRALHSSDKKKYRAEGLSLAGYDARTIYQLRSLIPLLIATFPRGI